MTPPPVDRRSLADGLEIRLFGGFEILGTARTVADLESQKVRGLLAYLLLHEGRGLARDELAGLLWPGAEADAARRNLRQALYDLRRTLPELAPAFAPDQRTVGFRAAPGDRFDVRDFLAAVRRGLPGGSEVLVAPLRDAVALYRGELLTGFAVRDSAPFEGWLLTEQERLRAAMMRALGALIEHLAARGEYDDAVAHAERRVEVDPLSEEAHRELMRLYLLVGRRRWALAQYAALSEVLTRELGAEPLPATRALHRLILAEAPSGEPSLPPPTPPLPFVPLVGRAEASAALSESWWQAAAGNARLVLVEGPSGVGKTRLARSFLGGLAAPGGVDMVQVSCLDGPPASPRQPLLDLERALDALDGAAGRRGPRQAGRDGGEAARELSWRALAAALGRRGRRPLVLFVDDLQWAAPGTRTGLVELVDLCADLPLWVLAARDTGPSGGPRPDPLDAHPRIDRVRLAGLGPAEAAIVAAALVEEGEAADRLAGVLAGGGEVLPLAVVERVNALHDEGRLVAAGRQRWRLTGAAEDSPVAGLELDAVIAWRMRRLPTSTRRLLALAAAIGPTFDVELLQHAAHEHMGVVEIGLELLLERWLVRHHVRRWSDTPRERDLALWAQGARRGSFELAHARLRAVALATLAGDRRHELHAQIAAALAALAADGVAVSPALLAHHRREAGGAAADQKKKRTPR